tara:strand:- start:566 stop:1939 length:1374 start_codon:yes stop_codon:yes gene_type:complete
MKTLQKFAMSLSLMSAACSVNPRIQLPSDLRDSHNLIESKSDPINKALHSVYSVAYSTVNAFTLSSLIKTHEGFDTTKPGAYRIGNSVVYFKDIEDGYKLSIENEGKSDQEVNIEANELLSTIYEIYYASFGLKVIGLSFDENMKPQIKKLTGENISNKIITTGVEEIELTTSESVSLRYIRQFTGKVSLPNATDLRTVFDPLFFQEFSAPSVTELIFSLTLPFASQVNLINLKDIRAILVPKIQELRLPNLKNAKNIEALSAKLVEIPSLETMDGVLDIRSCEELTINEKIEKTFTNIWKIGFAVKRVGDFPNFPKVILGPENFETLKSKFNLDEKFIYPYASRTNSNQKIARFESHDPLKEIESINIGSSDYPYEGSSIELEQIIKELSQNDLPEGKTIKVFISRNNFDSVTNIFRNEIEKLPDHNHLKTVKIIINGIEYIFNKDEKRRYFEMIK